MNKCKLKINGIEREFNVDGDFFWGKEEVLYNSQDNVISKTLWKDEGYTISKLLEQGEFDKLKSSIKNILIQLLQSNGVETPDDFELEKYHTIVTNDELHGKVINKSRELKNEDFDFDLNEILKKCVKLVNYNLVSTNSKIGRTHVQLRINRPKSLDINPLHRDGYLDVWNNCLNIWIPIAGCNINSNLPLLPGSHLINEKNIYRTESGNAVINKNTYNVPCILDIKGGINMIRHDIELGKGIVFTPFLIHGAAFNDNADLTRFALELRLEKQTST